MHTYGRFCRRLLSPLRRTLSVRHRVTTQRSSVSSVVIFKRSWGLSSPLASVSCVGLQSFHPFVCSKADWLRVREGAAPPLSSAYFIGSSSFNRFSCAGYINSV